MSSPTPEEKILEEITVGVVDRQGEWETVDNAIDSVKLASFLAALKAEVESLKPKGKSEEDAGMVGYQNLERVTENPDGTITYKGKVYKPNGSVIGNGNPRINA